MNAVFFRKFKFHRRSRCHPAII